MYIRHGRSLNYRMPHTHKKRFFSGMDRLSPPDGVSAISVGCYSGMDRWCPLVGVSVNSLPTRFHSGVSTRPHFLFLVFVILFAIQGLLQNGF